MKVKDLQEKLAAINPKAEVGAIMGVEGTELFNVLDLQINSRSIEEGANSVYLIMDKAENVEIVRKALLVTYDAYHPELAGKWDEEIRASRIDSMSDFLKSYLPCEIEEAVKIANEVIDEVSSLSVEEVKARSERKECIGGIINRIVGREIIPAILPDMK